MFEYSIYFSFNQNSEFERILKVISESFENFTIIDGNGFYNGNSEKSKELRIIDLGNNILLNLKLLNIIGAIKQIANQECILLTKREIQGGLI